MPIGSTPQHIPAYPYQVNIPGPPGLFLTIQVQGDGTPTTQDLDNVTQSLIDHLQTWSGRNPTANVTGSKYDLQLFDIQPTNPIPLPPPPLPEP